MNIREYDWSSAVAADLHYASEFSRAELQRRDTLAQGPSQVDQLARDILGAEGETSGGPWFEPTLIGYPTDWEVVHGSWVWRSTAPNNMHEPGGPDWEQVREVE